MRYEDDDIMRIAVIGLTSSEIISACHLTISRLATEGHVIYAIIAPLETSELSFSHSSEIAPDQKLLVEIGVAQAFLIEKFDYSAITQANGDAVNLHIKHIKPSIVIMPSWKSPNYMRRILARVSLIACRGIGSIWMYELDTKSADFAPSIIFEGSVQSASIQRANNVIESTATTSSITQDEIDIGKKDFTNNSILENKHAKTTSCELLKERFESHRTLLLEDELF